MPFMSDGGGCFLKKEFAGPVLAFLLSCLLVGVTPDSLILWDKAFFFSYELSDLSLGRKDASIPL